MIRYAFPDYPDLLLADARRVESEFKKKYLRGMHAGLGDASLGDWQGYASASEPRLASVYPTSGPTAGKAGGRMEKRVDEWRSGCTKGDGGVRTVTSCE